jgi:hypothetical protein
MQSSLRNRILLCVECTNAAFILDETADIGAVRLPRRGAVIART